MRTSSKQVIPYVLTIINNPSLKISVKVGEKNTAYVTMKLQSVKSPVLNLQLCGVIFINSVYLISLYTTALLWFFSKGLAFCEFDANQILSVELEHKMSKTDQWAGMFVDIKHMKHLNSGKRANGLMV